MEFYEVVGRRRSVRRFQSKPVEEDKIRRVLEAGLKAPSHNHLREWEFILLRDPENRKSVVELGAGIEDYIDEEKLREFPRKMEDPIQRELYLSVLPVQRRMLLSAPELLVVCFRMRKALGECETLFDLNCLASVWAAVENILLAMAAEGLYGVTLVPHKNPEPLKRMLNVPDGYEIAAMIPIGYPERYSVRQKEVLLEEKIHIDRW